MGVSKLKGMAVVDDAQLSHSGGGGMFPPPPQAEPPFATSIGVAAALDAVILNFNSVSLDNGAIARAMRKGTGSCEERVEGGVKWEDQWGEKVEEVTKRNQEWDESGEKPEEPREVCLYPQRRDAPDCSFYMKTGTCEYKHNCKFNHPPERESDGWGEKPEEPNEVCLHPQRPDAPDCSFYMKTGTCRYKHNCKFNHPLERAEYKVISDTFWKEKRKENIGGKVENMQCKYYLTSSGCKYGSVCKYGHHHQEAGSTSIEFNFMGLPIRHGEKECPFYMRTGCCSYSINCKFNHPDPTEAAASVPSDEPSPFMPDMHLPHQKPQVHDPTLYQVISNNIQIEKREENIAGSAEKLPCKYYLTSGGCKYGSLCKYGHHHQGTGSTSIEFNFMGLPIRHGEKECPFYMRTGCCSYSTNCKFNHPDPTEADEPSPYMPNMHLSHQKPYQIHDPTLYQLPHDIGDRHSVGHHLPYQPNGELPQQNGVPDCKTYKINHPHNQDSSCSTCLLSPIGLPLRPGKTACTHYIRYGICKFGPTCMYDHPISHFP